MQVWIAGKISHSESRVIWLPSIIDQSVNCWGWDTSEERTHHIGNGIPLGFKSWRNRSENDLIEVWNCGTSSDLEAKTEKKKHPPSINKSRWSNAHNSKDIKTKDYKNRLLLWISSYLRSEITTAKRTSERTTTYHKTIKQCFLSFIRVFQYLCYIVRYP